MWEEPGVKGKENEVQVLKLAEHQSVIGLGGSGILSLNSFPQKSPNISGLNLIELVPAPTRVSITPEHLFCSPLIQPPHVHVLRELTHSKGHAHAMCTGLYCK